MNGNQIPINRNNPDPELCIHAQTVNEDRDFYCHYYKEYNKCQFPKCTKYKDFRNAEK